MMKRTGGRALLNCCRGYSTRTANYISPVRKFSSTSSPAAGYNGASSPLGSLTVELDRIAPKFEIQASNIQILNSPAAFYDTLKVRVNLHTLKDGWLTTIRIKYVTRNEGYTSQPCILGRQNMSFFRSLMRAFAGIQT